MLLLLLPGCYSDLGNPRAACTRVCVRLCASALMAPCCLRACSCNIDNIQLCPLYALPDPYAIASTDKGLQRRLLEHVTDVHDPSKGAAEHFRLYQQTVAPFLAAVAPPLGAMVSHSSRADPQDLFVWSALVGEERLAQLFWVRCAKPVHMALLGAHLYGWIAHRKEGTGVVDELRQLEERMESLAIGVLEEAVDQV